MMEGIGSAARLLPRGRIATVLVGVLALLGTGLASVGDVTAQAVTASRAAESRFVELINNERTSEGLRPLRRVVDVRTVARRWSRQMAASAMLEHNPRFGGQICCWRRVAENVGVTSAAADPRRQAEILHEAFMASPGHRENVLGDFDEIGVGVEITDNGTMWVTENFRLRTRTLPAADAPSNAAGIIFSAWTVPEWNDSTRHTFRDVVQGWQQAPVGWLSSNNITQGVAIRRFAPARSVTRGQMAAFLWRFAGRPKISRPHGFEDVTKSWQQAPVRWLKARGITQGVAPGRYAPEQPVTRGQMAAFLWRLVDELADNPPHRFADVATSWQQEPVRWLRAFEITQGVTPLRFGPQQPVTRGQMAAFLWRLARNLH